MTFIRIEGGSMSNIYSDRADTLDALAESSKQTFDTLFKTSKSVDAQLVATSVVYAGAVVAAAMYRAMEKG
jgi:hypothetical protein